MTPLEYCKDKTLKSGSSFYYSFLFLPSEKRDAMTIIYAFCREIDDIVDEMTDANVAQNKLNWWRKEINAVFDTSLNPQHPVSKALRSLIKDFNLPQELFLEMIDGVEMDLNQNRYLDFKGLQLYCYRVASVVGLLTIEILGYQDRQTQKFAHDLGIALQLINIIRDVGADVQMGRIYLPLDELKQFDVDVQDILNRKSSENFIKLMQFQAERAKTFYNNAMNILPHVDKKSQKVSLIMGNIYFALLEEIENERFDVLNQKIMLTPVRKMWIASKTWLF